MSEANYEGSGAKLALVMRGAELCQSEGLQRKSSGKRRIPQFRHSGFPIPELPRLELTLLDLLRQLDSANSDCRVFGLSRMGLCHTVFTFSTESVKAPVRFLVIDHVERPSAN